VATDELLIFSAKKKVGRLWLDQQRKFNFEYNHSWLSDPEKSHISPLTFFGSAHATSILKQGVNEFQIEHGEIAVIREAESHGSFNIDLK
jgi:hypothetical protein